MYRFKLVILLTIIGFISVGCSKGEELYKKDPDLTPPKIEFVTPENQAVGISVYPSIRISFNEDLDESTIQNKVTLWENTEKQNIGIVYTNRVIVITPVNQLKYNTSYTVKIDSGVKDTAGNAIQTEYSWNFKTAVLQQVMQPEIDLMPGNYEGEQKVSIYCATSGVTIKYTINDQDPTDTYGTTYKTPITIDKNSTLKVVASRAGYKTSSMLTAVYKVVVASPNFSVEPGLYNNFQYVTLSCDTAGAVIKYTTNGNDPLTSGVIYSGETIVVNANLSVKAYAYKVDLTPSIVKTGDYTISLFDTANPEFSLISGDYSGVQSLVLSTNTVGAEIYYTTDNTTPSKSNGQLYNGAISITRNMAVKAIAVKNEMNDSQVIAAAYNIKSPQPEFSLTPGASYSTFQELTLSCQDAGAVIYYKIDNQNDWLVYNNETIDIKKDTEVQAFTRKSEWADSSVVSATFYIDLTKVSTPALQLIPGIYPVKDDDYVLEVTCATDGVKIIYTDDGSVPEAAFTSTGHFNIINGEEYSIDDKITFNCNQIFKVCAYKYEMEKSTVITGKYDVRLSAPQFDPANGYTFSGGSGNIKVDSPDSGVSNIEIYYTIDGSNPTKNSLKYNSDIMITQCSTIKAICYKNNYTPSMIVRGDFNVATPALATNRLKVVSAATVHDDASLQRGVNLSSEDVLNNGSRFQHDANNRVTDRLTRLEWYACPVAKNNFINALVNSTAEIAGCSDWRVPNIIELKSLINYNATTSTEANLCDTGFFDSSIKGKSFWSCTESDANNIQSVNITGNSIELVVKTETKYFLFVRANPSADYCGGSRYTVIDASTVSDAKCELTWTRAVVGNSDYNSVLNLLASYQVDGNIGYLGYKDWRLPTENELASLMSCGTASLLSDSIANGFDCSMKGKNFWSSTSVNGSSNYAWSVNFTTNEITRQDKTTGNYVLLVRGKSPYLSRSGQGGSYSNYDDGYYASGNVLPKSWLHFTAKNGYIVDNKTGLVWYIPANDSETMDYATALAGAESVVNTEYPDWRLPNVNELMTLIHYGTANSKEWMSDLGFVLHGERYWTATSLPNESKYWTVNLANNEVIAAVDTASASRIYVCDMDRFKIINNEILDSYSGIVWLKNISTTKYLYDVSANPSTINPYLTSLKHHGETWYIPSQSIFNFLKNKITAPGSFLSKLGLAYYTDAAYWTTDLSPETYDDPETEDDTEYLPMNYVLSLSDFSYSSQRHGQKAYVWPCYNYNTRFKEYNGYYYDKETGLMWKVLNGSYDFRSNLPGNPPTSNPNYVNRSIPNGYRLPTIREVMSLYNFNFNGKQVDVLNQQGLPINSNCYWLNESYEDSVGSDPVTTIYYHKYINFNAQGIDALVISIDGNETANSCSLLVVAP